MPFTFTYITHIQSNYIQIFNPNNRLTLQALTGTLGGLFPQQEKKGNLYRCYCIAINSGHSYG